MSTNVEIPRPSSSLPQPTSSPRKRRKRAQTAGAAADCFTCAGRSIKCDRRRPYCSQCLEGGKDCSGYKTQLTWGVGVASRGKLRGLALPVAGTQKTSKTPPQKPKKRGSGSEKKSQSPSGSRFVNPFGMSNGESSTPNDAKEYSSFNFIHSNPAPRALPTENAEQWRLQSFLVEMPTARSRPMAIKEEPAEPQQIPHQSDHHAPHFQDTFNGRMSVSSTSNYSHLTPESPTAHSATSESAVYIGGSIHDADVHIPNLSYPQRYQNITPVSWLKSQPHPSSSCSPVVSNQGVQIAPNEFGQQTVLAGSDQFAGLGIVDEPLQDEDGVQEIGHGDEDVPFWAISNRTPPIFADAASNYSLNLSPFAGMNMIGKTPRMQYLISYYTEVISPVIVAFDGPGNPYRTQILRVAAESETLQHAIAALSASNLRQRRETGTVSTGKTAPARRSSMAHQTLTDQAWHNAGLLSKHDQIREETFHKGHAIQSLNAQLANPLLRKDDSTLATLLILCLFHICDSGVARFKTQFAGVKKLLSLRHNDPRTCNSAETKWFTRMFTWFDAFTSTVNDREGQLQGYHLDMSALSDEEWALENLAGCDGRLFKTIARLGRLNVLAQGKPVESSLTIVCRPMPTDLGVPGMPQFPFGGDYGTFDDSGWSRMLRDENLFSAKTSPHATTGMPNGTDPATQFWREWREIRHELQTWYLAIDSSSPHSPTDLLTAEQRADLLAISESFRYSALLYTERLAAPTLPSADPAIQGLVQQALHFIHQVKSDVYLLWPLFITGSECVRLADRAVIRLRCLDIQKDSGFYNNQSCLELLEKVWQENPAATSASAAATTHDVPSDANVAAPAPGLFRFSNVIMNEREDDEGEYIVV